MPWRVLIRRKDRRPLGDFPAVLQALEGALPEAFTYRAPQSVSECRMDYVAEDLTVRFVLSSDSDIERIAVQVRGTGNPLPILARVVRVTGWIVEEASGETVNVKARSVSSWQGYLETHRRITDAFRAFRFRGDAEL